MWGLNFAPRGWAFCDGRLLPIAQNTALFSLLGTTYGGDGRTTFGLPDLRGRIPIHFGQQLGQHFHHGHIRSQCRINAAQFQADIAATRITELGLDGYVVNAIMDACYKSVETRQWAPVDLEIWRGSEGTGAATGVST